MIAVFLLLLTVTSALGVYPIQKAVVYNPQDFDVLYHSAKGAFQETWTFAKTVRVTAFYLASQVNLCGGAESYRENVTVKISKVYRGQWTLVAEVQFEGEVAYGKEIRVPMMNRTTSIYPELLYTNGFYYSVGVEFGGEVGVYPWHTTRDFSGACATINANNPGHIIGIEYTW